MTLTLQQVPERRLALNMEANLYLSHRNTPPVSKTSPNANIKALQNLYCVYIKL